MSSRYLEVYGAWQADPHAFWAQAAREIDWIKPPQKIFDPDGGVYGHWFPDATCNTCYNALDRHVEGGRADQPALIYDSPLADSKRIYTYAQLRDEVAALAAVMQDMGIVKGDRVIVYMPMIAQAVMAMLACARIGAVHSVVFGGFAAKELATRINDATPRLILTASCGIEPGRIVKYKPLLDQAIELAAAKPEKVLLLQRPQELAQMIEGRDYDWASLTQAAIEAGKAAPCVELAATDPLYILYTSGTTGIPKGVVRDNGGHMVALKWTMRNLYGIEPGEAFWAASDVGWVVGHSYIVYGPLANGATTLMYEGVPNWPTPARIWEVVDKHQVHTIFTAPTALRALMKEGDDYVHSTSRASLRVLGTVGEPINPEAWRWYHGVIGEGRCPIIDTWWQTETGGAMIAPMPGATDLKPGSATLPMPGVIPQILDGDGAVQEGATEGNLVIAGSWPGQMRTVWGDHDRFFQTYFTTFPGKYTTGDGARRDTDGYYWITGRVDDVINVSGHRMGTAEVESALVLHESVAEAAVVGFPHDIKGQGIYAYVTLNANEEPSDNLRKDLVKWVRTEIGPIATPDAIQFAPGLPKTRSGKIMRRILRKIAEGEVSAQALGDVSTLADPSVVDNLVANRQG